MSIETELKEFIAGHLVPDPHKGEVLRDEPLVSSGRVDSLGLLQILGFIQRQYGVDLVAWGGPKDCETIASLAAAVQRALGAR